MPLNNDFPVPLVQYARVIVGTPEEVWLTFLRLEHGNERHTELRWNEIVVSYRDNTPLVPETPATSIEPDDQGASA